MKPFNLEEALAGKPVVTRDGREVTQLHLFDCDSDHPLIGVIDNKGIYQFRKNGRYYKEPDSGSDLFMAPEKVTKWANIYKNPVTTAYHTGSVLYDSENIAKKYADKNWLVSVPVTFEI